MNRVYNKRFCYMLHVVPIRIIVSGNKTLEKHYKKETSSVKRFAVKRCQLNSMRGLKEAHNQSRTHMRG